jgi:hypothetical protein
LENQLQVNRFHNLFYELSVALKATLPLAAEIKSPPGATYGELIEVRQDKGVKRACMPAMIVGDPGNGGRLLEFKQWFDPTPVEFYQLCFNLKPITKKTLKFRKLMFGRANESEPFGFRTTSPFINLKFLRRSEEDTDFEPLYCRVIADNGNTEYYEILAGMPEDAGAFVVTKKVSPEVAPKHLREALL